MIDHRHYINTISQVLTRFHCPDDTELSLICLLLHRRHEDLSNDQKAAVQKSSLAMMQKIERNVSIRPPVIPPGAAAQIVVYVNTAFSVLIQV